jgi:cytochrome c oxidase subunit II
MSIFEKFASSFAGGLNKNTWVRFRNKATHMTKIQQLAMRVSAVGAAMAATVASAEMRYDLKPQITEIGRMQHDLHIYIMWVISVIFVAVFGVMFYSLYAHRKSKGHKAAQFHEHVGVEIAWTVIPFLILVVMAFPATKAVLAMKDTSSPDLTIKVTGYQWKWGYDYIHDGFGYLSNLSTPLAQIENREAKAENYLLEVDNPMVVPMNRKVRVLITANDVLHAWYVPELGVKQDAIPGFVRDAWFKADKPGIYRGQCAELCGKEHGFMPIVVEVKTEADYDKWVAEQKKKNGVAEKKIDAAPTAAAAVAPVASAAAPAAMTKDEMMAHGKGVYEANCLACHGADGKGNAALKAKALDGSAVVTGPKAQQIAMLLEGKAGTAMSSFKQLSDKDLASVATYTKNTWGNKAGEIQPGDFFAARNGAVAPSAIAAAAPTGAALPAKLYFDSGKTDLPANTKEAVSAAVEFLKANANAKLALSGYVDKTGNADQNAELAKNRAKAVRDALKSAGVDEARIEMRKPETLTGAANDKEARRVEIIAVK